MTKICNTCKVEKDLTEFQSNGYYKDKKKYKPNCKDCTNVAASKQKFKRVLEALVILGKTYKCERCGYDKNYAALDFHHIDPTIKKFRVGCSNTRSLAALVEEMKKCIIICANCHREEHHPEFERKLK